MMGIRRQAVTAIPRPPLRRRHGRRRSASSSDGKERLIQNMMVTSCWSPDGRPMSAAQFVEKLFGELPALFADEDELRKLWSVPDTRKSLLEGRSEKGLGDEQLREIARMIDAAKSDVFDVMAYIAFAMPPITRTERVDTRKVGIVADYDDKLQTFLDFVLGQYVQEGVGELDNEKLPALLDPEISRHQ